MLTPERRQIPRTAMERLAYIDIEPNNGGIVLNVSPDGLCFLCGSPVSRQGTISVSTQRLLAGALYSRVFSRPPCRENCPLVIPLVA